MSLTDHTLRIFLGSPGDLELPRAWVKEVVEKFDHEFKTKALPPGASSPFRIDLVAWENVEVPKQGELWQDLIDRRLKYVEQCQIAIFLFAARLGSPMPAFPKPRDQWPTVLQTLFPPPDQWPTGSAWEHSNCMAQSMKTLNLSDPWQRLDVFMLRENVGVKTQNQDPQQWAMLQNYLAHWQVRGGAQLWFEPGAHLKDAFIAQLANDVLRPRITVLYDAWIQSFHVAALVPRPSTVPQSPLQGSSGDGALMPPTLTQPIVDANARDLVGQEVRHLVKLLDRLSPAAFLALQQSLELDSTTDRRADAFALLDKLNVTGVTDDTADRVIDWLRDQLGPALTSAAAAGLVTVARCLLMVHYSSKIPPGFVSVDREQHYVRVESSEAALAELARAAHRGALPAAFDFDPTTTTADSLKPDWYEVGSLLETGRGRATQAPDQSAALESQIYQLLTGQSHQASAQGLKPFQRHEVADLIAGYRRATGMERPVVLNLEAHSDLEAALHRLEENFRAVGAEIPTLRYGVTGAQAQVLAKVHGQYLSKLRQVTQQWEAFLRYIGTLASVPPTSQSPMQGASAMSAAPVQVNVTVSGSANTVSTSVGDNNTSHINAQHQQQAVVPDAFVAAITQLVDKLEARLNRLEGMERGEVQDVITNVRAELAKAQPSRSTIRDWLQDAANIASIGGAVGAVISQFWP